MPTLPWTAPKNSRSSTGELVVMASRFQLQAWRDVAPFFVASFRIRRQMLNSPGVVGVSLIARPTSKTFYTLSAWQDRASLDATVAHQPHAATMNRFRSRTTDSLFAFWSIPATDGPPTWDEAQRRLQDEQARRAPRSQGTI